MIIDGRVTGLPLVDYANTKAAIEALTLTAADAGARAYATDDDEIGVYDGAAWAWLALVDYLTAAEHTAIGDGAPHHAAVTLKAGHDAALSLSGQELDLADVLTPTEHTAIGDGAPHHARYTDAEALTQGTAAVATHVGLLDPHTQYQKESEKGAASGYASLDASVLVPAAQLPAATTEAQGATELATVTEVKAGVDTTRAVTPAGVAGVIALATPASDGGVIKSGAGVLTLAAAAGAYTVTVNASCTIADWFDQSVKVAATPTFASVIMPNAGYIGNGAATALLGFDSSGATDYAYFSNCYLGIGTPSPETILHAYNAAVGPTFRLTNAATIQYSSPGFSLVNIEIADTLNEVFFYYQKDSAGAATGTGTFTIRARQKTSTGNYIDYMRFNTSTHNITFNASKSAGNTYGDVIVANGNVGIGTTSPQNNLEITNISGTVDVKYQLLVGELRSDNPASGNGVGIQFGLSNNSIAPSVRASIRVENVFYKQRSKMIFQTAYGDTLYDRMTIDESGNVGIGTTSPTYTLDITGNLRCSTGFGCNGATPQTAYAVNVASSDLATVIALCNQLRAALVANGVCV